VSKSNSSAFWGMVLLVLGVVWLLNNVGVMYFDLGDFLSRAWPAAIIIVGVWLLFGGRHRKTVTQVDATETVSHSVGDVDLKPGEIGHDGLHVNVSAGEVHLDLGATRFQDRENWIVVKLGLGDIRIVVPKSLPVKIEGRTGIGDLHIFDNHRDGFGAKLDFQDPDYERAQRKLYLVAKSGLGDVKVTRSA
jgi:lia operon protein LiaF